MSNRATSIHHEEKIHTPVGPSFKEGGVSIVDAVHSENWRMDWTIHPYQKVLLIVDGSGYIEDGTFAWPIKKGVVVYIPDHWRYRVTDNPDTPVSLFILFFKTEIFGTHKDVGFGKRPIFFSQESFAQGGLERMRLLFYEQSANLPGSQEILRGMAWRFLGEIKRAHSRTLPEDVPVDPSRSNEARVQHFLTELNDKFFQPVSLEAIAKRLVMSKRTLTSLFRKLTGKSVLEYVQDLRIEHAKKLLRDSNRSIITISFECGFDNLSNFYRTFKKLTGYSPNEWRRKSKIQKKKEKSDKCMLGIRGWLKSSNGEAGRSCSTQESFPEIAKATDERKQGAVRIHPLLDQEPASVPIADLSRSDTANFARLYLP